MTLDSYDLPPMLAEDPALHERACSLDLNSWRVLAALPRIFAEVGATVPVGIAELLEHAKRLSLAVPLPVLEALVAEDDGAVRCTSQPARHWGFEVGLWRPHETDRNVGRWGLARAYWTLADLDVLVSLTPLGRIVREHCRAREERARSGLPRSTGIGEPFKPWHPHEVPPVIEDGTRGIVAMKLESEDAGPVYIIRGVRCEPLFHGLWVSVGQARRYAEHFGHGFVPDLGLAVAAELREIEDDHGGEP